MVDGILRYKKGSKDLHVLFEYLEVGKVCKLVEEIDALHWHPHASGPSRNKPNNAIYVGSDNLTGTDLPGFGTFRFSKDLILTKEGYTRSKWQLPEVLRDKVISYHQESSKKTDYFQSACIGQEFVIDGDTQIFDWVYNLIKNHRIED